MTRFAGGGGARGILAGLVLAATAPAAVAQDAPAAEESVPLAAPPDSSTTVLLVFVSAEGGLPSYPDPAGVRYAVSRALAYGLAQGTTRVVTYPQVETVMRRWRVRSERDVGAAFLDDLVAEYDAEQVVIATLGAYRDRVRFVARGFSPATGHLQWVESDELPRTLGPESDADTISAEVEGLAAQAARTLARAAATPAPHPPAAEPVAVVPLTPVGVDRGPAGVALSCLLRSLLDSAHWAVVEPTLVASAMVDEGYDPRLLESGSRRAVAARFGTAVVLVPRLVSFDLETRRTSTAVAGDGFGEARGAAESPLYLSLVAVDCESGRLLGGGAEYLAWEKPYGIFGVPKDFSLTRRFQLAADRLVRSLPPIERGGS